MPTIAVSFNWSARWSVTLGSIEYQPYSSDTHIGPTPQQIRYKDSALSSDYVTESGESIGYRMRNQVRIINVLSFISL